MSIDADFFGSFFNLLIGEHPHLHGRAIAKYLGICPLLDYILNVRSVEIQKLMVAPLKPCISEFEDALSVIEFISTGFGDSQPHIVFCGGAAIIMRDLGGVLDLTEELGFTRMVH